MSASLPPRSVLIALAVAVATATVIALLLQPSSEQIEEIFGGDGLTGPAIFALAYAVLTLAFVPGAPLTLAAGALYGVGGGFAVVMAGASAGAIGAFLVARRAARGTVERASDERLAAIERRLEGRGFYAMLVLRLIPVVPFSALNYAAGASPIGTRDYVLATVIGIMPGAFAYTAVGAGIDDPLSPLFIGAVALTILLAFAAKRYGDRFDDESGSAEVRRLLFAAGCFLVAIGTLAALTALGLFH